MNLAKISTKEQETKTELENHKKSEMKTTLTEMQDILQRIENGVDEAEDKFRDLEDIKVEDT